MVWRKTRLAWLVLVTVLILNLFLLWVGPIQAQNGDEFPIGLSVEYEIHDDNFQGVNRFEFIEWLVNASNVITMRWTQVQHSGSDIVEIIHIDLSTWTRVFENGTSIGVFGLPPFLVDVSNWDDDDNVSLIHSTRTYQVSGQIQHFTGGIYSCWLAHSYEYDFDLFSGWSRSESLYYEQVLGVLLRWHYSYEILFSPHIRTEYSLELRGSNLILFGRPPVEAFIPAILIIIGIVGFTVIPLTCYFSRRRPSPPPRRRTSTTEPSVEIEPPQYVHPSVEEPVQEVITTESPDPTLPLCIVCHHHIGIEVPTLMCPHCGGEAHRSHLLEWLKVKGTCPNCGRKLSRSDFD